jgi:hypothetical protein
VSGYVSVMAPCWACGKPVLGNPRTVPSKNNQPVCKDCMTLLNQMRCTAGLAPFVIPPDAYEACPESSL